MRWRMRLGAAAADRDGPGPRHVIPPRVLDAVTAVTIAALGLVSGLGARAQHEHMPLAALPVLAAMGLVLYPRRRHPAVVLGAVTALVVTLVAMGATLGGSFLAVLCAAYSAAVYGSRRLVIVVVAGAVAAILFVGIPQALGYGGTVQRVVPIPTILAAAGAALFGLLIRNQFSARNSQLAVMAERAEWAAEQRAQEARRATLAERLRIARELHDIVAHHVSVIVIQAQGAQRMVDRDPDRSRQAMADIETLVTSMAAAGLRVTLRTTGEPRPVPEDVGLTGYRIVQEALTNVLKHAGPAQAHVLLDYGEQLEITVTDDGRGAAAGLTGPPGAGRGTTGMRERVSMLGGQLTAGPQPGGGFRVHAAIPSPYLPPDQGMTAAPRQPEVDPK